MPHPQSAIIPEPHENALFLILKVRDSGATTLRTVAKVCAQSPHLTAEIATKAPEAMLVSALGIGASLWDMLSPSRRPRGLHPFKAINSKGLSAPATDGDLLVHIISRRHDINFELAMRLRRELGDAVEVVQEVHGFRYLDGRDLTGFIDGTENPKGDDERIAAALIGDDDPEFAGGSYAFTQRYVHDLAKWSGLSVVDQEKAVGRRKADSEDLPAAEKPPTAHITRATIEENGVELKIVRHSFPYGTVSEAGLFFIAYAKDLDIPERLLSRMFGTSGDGLHDRLMEFTSAVSGTNFFVPSLEVLKSLAA